MEHYTEINRAADVVRMSDESFRVLQRAAVRLNDSFGSEYGVSSDGEPQDGQRQVLITGPAANLGFGELFEEAFGGDDGFSELCNIE